MNEELELLEVISNQLMGIHAQLFLIILCLAILSFKPKQNE